MFNIASLLADARLAQGHIAHVPAGMTEPTAFVPKPAVVSSVLGLDADHLPALFDKDGNIVRTPYAAPGGKTVKLDAAIAQFSRVAQAGAIIAIRGEPKSAHAIGLTDDVMVMTRDVGAMHTVEPAPFAILADDAEVSAGTFPLSIAEIDFSTAPVRAVRFELPRSMQRSVGRELLGAEILTSLVLGIARAADAVLLESLAFSDVDVPALSDFSIARAAAAGLRFDELRALIGTTGTGAEVDAAGALRAAGIPAELTADIAGSYVGSFARSGIAIHADVPVHIERRDLAGNLAVTAFVTMQALVPDRSRFWKVPAA